MSRAKAKTTFLITGVQVWPRTDHAESAYIKHYSVCHSKKKSVRPLISVPPKNSGEQSEQVAWAKPQMTAKFQTKAVEKDHVRSQGGRGSRGGITLNTEQP